MSFEKSFDFIAMPKGQIPGGPVQASDGTWYLVTPLLLSLADTIESVRKLRAGRPVRADEIEQAMQMLRQEPAK